MSKQVTLLSKSIVKLGMRGFFCPYTAAEIKLLNEIKERRNLKLKDKNAAT